MSRTGSIGLAAVAAAFALVAVAPRTARADKCDDQQNGDNEKSGKKNYKTIIGPDGRKVFVIEKAFVVCGKVPKPNVIYVLQASTINYEWETLKQDFLPKIGESVRKAPF
jgi:hypothetical protein